MMDSLVANRELVLVQQVKELSEVLIGFEARNRFELRDANGATIGYAAPQNYHQVTFDNGAHESTGGQPTPSPAVDFALAALACGYKHAETVSDPAALRATLPRRTGQARHSSSPAVRKLIRSRSA